MKMKLFNDIIGNDTKILTADEQPQSVLRNIMVDARSKDEEESWDAVHRNVYNEAYRIRVDGSGQGHSPAV